MEVRFLVWLVIWVRTGVSGRTVSSATVHQALNWYLEKSGEGKQEGFAKAEDGRSPTPLHFLTEISTASFDFKGSNSVSFTFFLISKKSKNFPTFIIQKLTSFDYYLVFWDTKIVNNSTCIFNTPQILQKK